MAGNREKDWGVFINKSKIQFEIYSQPHSIQTLSNLKCLSINQRYNLKSIHNRLKNSINT